jgi:AbrB family looped-hinge helix DNA binding protein
MKNVFQVRVSRRGTITIPRELRDINKTKEGTLLMLTELGDGVLIMRQHRSSVNETANMLEKEWRQAGQSLPTMLEALHQVRKEMDRKTL